LPVTWLHFPFSGVQRKGKNGSDQDQLVNDIEQIGVIQSRHPVMPELAESFHSGLWKHNISPPPVIDPTTIPGRITQDTTMVAIPPVRYILLYRLSGFSNRGLV
jgi:hypothetical protein